LVKIKAKNKGDIGFLNSSGKINGLNKTAKYAIIKQNSCNDGGESFRKIKRE
jgi:hypothetical protein